MASDSDFWVMSCAPAVPTKLTANAEASEIPARLNASLDMEAPALGGTRGRFSTRSARRYRRNFLDALEGFPRGLDRASCRADHQKPARPVTGDRPRSFNLGMVVRHDARVVHGMVPTAAAVIGFCEGNCGSLAAAQKRRVQRVRDTAWEHT